MGDVFFHDCDEVWPTQNCLLSACTSGNWVMVKEWLRLGAVVTPKMHAAAFRVLQEFNEREALLQPGIKDEAGEA